MRYLRKTVACVLTVVFAMGLLTGCKVIDIPEDAWFLSSSSSSSSFVEELTELDDAEPVDDTDILYYDALNGAKLFSSLNPDTTYSLIYESAQGERTRLFTTPERRQIVYPLMNDAGTMAAFLVMGNGGEIKVGEYMGQLYTVSLTESDASCEAQDLYVRSYKDYPRGYYWYSSDTLFISSAVESTGEQDDCIGFFNVPNSQMNNIVGGEHPVDTARQGVVSPDGKLITYSGYYSSNSRFVHCVFDVASGETTYWYDRTNTGLSGETDAITCYRFIDDTHIVKVRTYTMNLDADGNIIYDDTTSEDQEVSDPEDVVDESLTESAVDEVTGDTVSETTSEESTESAAETSTASSEAQDSSAASETSSEESTEPQQIIVNSICTMDVYTGELTMLIEHAYNPVVNADGTKIYFHYTSYNRSVDADNLTERVFCYDVATGEIEEVTQSLGITSSYDVLKLEQRIYGDAGK